MEIVLIAVSVVLLAISAMMVAQARKKGPDVTAMNQELMQTVQLAQQQNLQIILEQLNQHRQSSENLSGQLHNRVAETGRVVYELQTRLAQLQENNKRILDMSQGIADLQNILQAPKLRGERGEIWLEELLTQMIPKQHISIQHRFKSGEVVDAAIKLRDNLLLPIDSKFSLENFKKMMDRENPDAKQHEKLFVSDVKKRIDEISRKYILPTEGTLQYAFMYVPAENVYYQAFIEDKGGFNLTRYAFEHHVIPVSPNSLYPYLEIVMFGLRGLEIEQSAQEIQRGLVELHGDLSRFDEDYRKVGVHLKNAAGSFESSDKRLSKVQLKLGNLSKKEIAAGDPLPTLLDDPAS
ncbi:MAG TPA: DNA recombination protein RmuC [Verrucomicrobiae bacterium]|nr:DNA recombination protein RmuC [Verrucomicrobiae bacterium]